jgi:hypothetical protein
LVCAEFTPFLGEGLILIVTVNGRRLISLMTNAVEVKQGVESNLAFLQARSIVQGRSYYQPSAISHQPSAISHQPSAISHQPIAAT